LIPPARHRELRQVGRVADGGVAADTCLAFNRKCWNFDIEDRPDTRLAIGTENKQKVTVQITNLTTGEIYTARLAITGESQGLFAGRNTKDART